MSSLGPRSDRKTAAQLGGVLAVWWASYQREVTFLDGGRIWPRVDCYGFLRVALAREQGLLLPEWPGLTREGLALAGRGFAEGVFTAGFRAIESGCEEGFDCALIRRPMPVNGVLKKGWWHCGIVSRPGFIVHLEPAQGIVETPFRDTGLSLGDPSLREKDVLLYRACVPSAACATAQEQAA